MQSSRAAFLVVVAFVALLVAGCTSKANGPSPIPGAGQAQDLGLTATSTTGLIHGVVVDDAVRPLPNADVRLEGSGVNRSAVTDASGRFGFDHLLAGAYLVRAAKAGYVAAKTEATVVAGVQDPPAVKLQLAADLGNQPYFQGQVFEGFTECTTAWQYACGEPNAFITGFLCPSAGVCPGNITNDRQVITLYYDANATLIQSELVWEATQSASPSMTIRMDLPEADPACPAPAAGDLSYTPLNMSSGPSPLVVAQDAARIAQFQLGPRCGIEHGVVAGGVPGAPCVPTPDGSGLPQPICAGLSVEQRFTVYSHAFYNFLPAQGWRFATDGEPVPPGEFRT